MDKLISNVNYEWNEEGMLGLPNSGITGQALVNNVRALVNYAYANLMHRCACANCGTKSACAINQSQSCPLKALPSPLKVEPSGAKSGCVR